MLDLKYILIKVFVIILFVVIYYALTNSNINHNKKNNLETFIDSIENEKINYLKLRETYIEPQDTSLELLYANYYGEEVGNNVWENKTLDQCTDICNKIDNCSGFTRDLVLDTEPSNCYPNNTINKCYSNRKGNINQMQNAIKYNSFVKSNVPNLLNMCIGDAELTLNRIIFIKPYAMPNTCLGISGDSRITIIDINKENFNVSCNFRLEPGKDGIGTVSFLHIDTGKYLFRDNSDNLILKTIIPGQTENNQRASFNLYDSKVGSGSIMLKTMSIEGETRDKFVYLDNNYLNIKQIPIKNVKNNDNEISFYDKSTFYIIDSIVNSNIITNKTNLPVSDIPLSDIPVSDIPLSTIPLSTIPVSNTNIEESFTVNLDKTNNISVYNNIFSTPESEKFNLINYLQDNYDTNNNNHNSKYVSITNKYNDIIIKNQLSKSLTKQADQYNSIFELNMEIEKEIQDLNLGLNAKNDKIIIGLDNMKITDMANDYFFLKNLNKK